MPQLIRKLRRSRPTLFAAVFAAAAITVAYLIVDGSIGHREIGTAFLAMIGTFIGAALAFRLKEHKEQLAEIRRQKIRSQSPPLDLRLVSAIKPTSSPAASVAMSVSNVWDS